MFNESELQAISSFVLEIKIGKRDFCSFDLFFNGAATVVEAMYRSCCVE